MGKTFLKYFGKLFEVVYGGVAAKIQSNKEVWVQLVHFLVEL